MFALLRGVAAGDGTTVRPDEPRGIRFTILLALAIVFPLLVLLAYLATRSVLSYSAMLEIAAQQGGATGFRIQQVGNSSYQQLPGQPLAFLNPQTLSGSSLFGAPAVSSIEVLLVIAAAVAFLMVWRGFRVRLGSTEPFEDDGLAAEERRTRVADVLDAAAARLGSGSSYRDTVIQCYKTISVVLGDRSDVDGRVLTAREFEAQVVEKLKVGPGYLSRMTGLFEVAKYSEHEITEEQSREAMVCLSEMSAALKQPGLEVGTSL